MAADSGAARVRFLFAKSKTLAPQKAIIVVFRFGCNVKFFELSLVPLLALLCHEI